MKKLLTVLLLSTSGVVFAENCETAITTWCERHAIDPARNCLDLTRQACPRVDHLDCIRQVMDTCVRGSFHYFPVYGNDCAGAAVAYCTRLSNDHSPSILNEADFCLRHTSHGGEWCLSEALRRNPQ